jgi:hypothetical protein
MRFRLALIGALAALGGSTASAAGLPEIIQPASVGAPADRETTPFDVVSVGQLSVLSPTVEQAAARAASKAGGVAVNGRSAMVPMTRITRGATAVQQAPAGFFIPMGVTVLPAEAAVRLMSADTSAALGKGLVVMGATSAALRGAVAGDVIELQAADGSLVSLTIGRVANDDEIGGAELVVAPTVADRLGLTAVTRVVIWGFRSRTELDAALVAQGLVPPNTRISRSWDPPNPDSVISLSMTKKLLGEFAFRPTGTDSVDLAGGWSNTYIHPKATFTSIPVRAACHNVVHPAIQGALTEIAAAGLGDLVNVANTNAVGGCFNPRYNRVTGNLGFLSRHSWGQAFDMNISENPQGATPKLDCRIVRIFRKWGFAWGGNFISKDGQHFEWVGQQRDLLLYPSTYCSNIGSPGPVPTRAAKLASTTSSPLATMFASDGFSLDG